MNAPIELISNIIMLLNTLPVCYNIKKNKFRMFILFQEQIYTSSLILSPIFKLLSLFQTSDQVQYYDHQAMKPLTYLVLGNVTNKL
jgi:hypothetical protein